jgi:hypothetical protein
MRVLRNAQRWLSNIGPPFIQVGQIGFTNLRSENRLSTGPSAMYQKILS